MKVLVENEPKLDLTKMIADNKQKTIIIAVASVLIIAAGIGFWYWSKSEQAQEESSTLGDQIFDKIQNPLGGHQVSDTNPFKNQKNPLDTIYQNPFE